MRRTATGTLRGPAQIVAVLLAAAAAAAQPAPPQDLTPETAVEIAVANHPMIRAADRDVEAADADRKLARSGWLPRVDLTEDYVRSTNPTFVFASKLGQERFTAADFDLNALNQPPPFTNSALRLIVKQNVWDAGRTRHYQNAAAAGSEAASAVRARTRDEIAFGAVRSFWDAVLADEMLKVARAAEEAARANASVAGELVDAGAGVPSDKMQAEVRLKEVEAMRIRAEQGVEVARASVRQALGLPDDAAFTLEPPEVSPDDAVDTPDVRVTEAMGSRADLQALALREKQAEIGQKIARSTFIPEIGVGAQVEMNGSSFLGNDGTNWTVGAMARIPIFTGMEGNARVARARADTARVEAYRQAMADGVRLQVRAAWADRSAAAERLRTAESALALADEALRIVRERYQEGMAVMVELLGAEASRTSAQGNRAAAARDLAVARSSLDLASGRPLAPPVPTAAATETTR